MKHLLISATPDMATRWHKAFNNGRYVTFEQLEVLPKAIIWLDLSTLSAEEKQRQIARVVATGQVLVVLTTAPDKLEAMSVVRLGAKGYGHLLSAPAQFLQMATVVSHGGYWLGQDLLDDVIEQTVNTVTQAAAEQQPTIDDGRSLLTGRECDVANEVARGASNREIAEKLHVSERTVKAHLSMIFDKLAVRDRVQLALRLNCVSI